MSATPTALVSRFTAISVGQMLKRKDVGKAAFALHASCSSRASELVAIGCLVDFRAGRQNRQNWLQGKLAGLTCNLPEQLHDLMLTGPSAGAVEGGPVTRRDILELLPAATVRSVLAVQSVSHVHVSVLGCLQLPVHVCVHSPAHAHVCAHVCDHV